MLAFAALYAFMPNTKVKLVPALVAGAVTGVLWKVLGFLFGVFVAGSASYATIYSAFAALILFMIWIYIGWLIVLVGASISYYLQYPSNQRVSRRMTIISPRVREKLALLILMEVGNAFYRGQTTPALPEIAKRLRVPIIAVENIVTVFLRTGLLAVVDDGARLIPGRPFDTTTVFDMMTDLRVGGESSILSFDHLAKSEAADKVLLLSDRAAQVVLGKITLKQLLTGEISA